MKVNYNERLSPGWRKPDGCLVPLAALLFISFIFIAGCMTPQKAVRYLKEKKLLDDTCAANYPCITTDSIVTITKTDSAQYLDVISSLHSDLQYAWQLNDSLLNVVNAPVNITDTNCRKYSDAIYRLRKENEMLQKRLHNIPAVHDTVTIVKKVRDTALEQTYHDKADQATKDLEKMTGKKEWWNKAALITWGLLLLLLLAIWVIKKFTLIKK